MRDLCDIFHRESALLRGNYMGYHTKQGELVVTALKKAGDMHMTADEIARSLDGDGCSIGKSTVYRQLEKLVAAGQVRRFKGDKGDSACYQYISSDRCHNHYHLKCSVCGKLFHVECEYLDKVAEHVLLHHGFILSDENTVLYGVCSRCSK